MLLRCSCCWSYAQYRGLHHTAVVNNPLQHQACSCTVQLTGQHHTLYMWPLPAFPERRLTAARALRAVLCHHPSLHSKQGPACDNCIARSTLRHHRHHHRILLFCCELRGHQMPQQGAWPSRGCQQQYGAVAGSTMTALHLRTLLHKYTTKCDWHITCLHMAYSGTSI